MDFGLTDEQRMLRDTARSFVAKTCPVEVAQAWDESATFPAELFAGMAEQGWLGLALPEELGGDGGSAVELGIITEQLGHASLDVAMCFAGCLIPGLTVLRWGTPQQRERYLPAMLRGTGRFAIAMSEPDAGSDVAALRTRAVQVPDGFVLNGQKMWCTGAGLPGTTIALYARTDPDAEKHHGLSLLLVDPAADGIRIQRTPTLARHILGTNEVFLTDVHVPAGDLVGELHGGWRVLLSGLDLERVLMSAAYVGVAQATLDEMLAYSKTRTQFGRQIGTFQALAHAMADLQTDIDSARLLAQRAAWLHAHGRPCSRESAMAKLKGSETYVNAARWGMQVLGGHGFATESTMSFRWRESIVATISGGTSQIQRNAIARSMGLRCY